jgi:hypothetical protein
VSKEANLKFLEQSGVRIGHSTESEAELHRMTGVAESQVEHERVESPHVWEHSEKEDVVPRPADNGYHTDGSGVAIAPSPEVSNREPARPEGADGFRERKDKQATHGFADHKRARGHEYSEEKVDTTDHTKNAFDTDARKYVEAHGNPKVSRSSFGGHEYKS